MKNFRQIIFQFNINKGGGWAWERWGKIKCGAIVEGLCGCLHLF